MKTAADMDKFARSVYDYRYHVQAPYYCDGNAAHFGEQPAAFVLLVVSTSIECGSPLMLTPAVSAASGPAKRKLCCLACRFDARLQKVLPNFCRAESARLT
ncbi:hypothetical protein [Stutzerimonas xanthomarina]|uniref:hypothetical protein n=1 Tax=Stutzerimonas xanthomarina TaxID=271420 RepID=UPI003AA83183